MGLPLYLAQTHREMLEAQQERSAYMACHFSSYGDGLELWEDIPSCNMVILNDRIPVWNHDPEKVAAQLGEILKQAGADSVLLDLQRPGCPAAILNALTALPYPVGVTERYAAECDCGVLVELPMHRPLSDALKKWPGRELWLDAAGNTQRITVTAEGASFTSLPPCVPEGICHRDKKLHCRYHIDVKGDRAEFTLFRTKEDLHNLLQEAEDLGFTKAIGLYQELIAIHETVGEGLDPPSVTIQTR